MQKKVSLFSAIIVIAMLLSACGMSSLPLLRSNLSTGSSQPQTAALAPRQAAQVAAATPTAAAPAQNSAAPVISGSNSALLSAYQDTLENIYQQVNPSVVNINVVENVTPSQGSGAFGGQSAQPAQALGSGFVWDMEGHIVTNNHVVAGASKIDVTFTDGVSVPAKVVGVDPYADLAVIQVSTTGLTLVPVKPADSTQVKVGQLAIAIGNPFGLSNTMTVGVVSAMGRSIPSTETTSQTPGASGYTIPDIIQTDAPINPGNSGGVLLNDQGQLIGVTAAIESPSQANAGIGFAIPSSIVSKVVPGLIKTGSYQHAYLGISGVTLTPDLAQAMNLDPKTRGALVEDVNADGPSAQAGLKASAQAATISGSQVNVGGDVITAVNGKTITNMDELISYLFGQTEVGQKITLTVLRGGSSQSVEVTLQARPADQSANNPTGNVPSQGNGRGNNGTGNGSNNGNNNSGGTTQPATAGYLGISTVEMNAAISAAMNLPVTQNGVLVEEVQSGGPADKAGLKAGTKTVALLGQDIILGGDVITAIDSTPVSNSQDLSTAMHQTQPDQMVKLTVLRDGKTILLSVTLGTRPAQ